MKNIPLKKNPTLKICYRSDDSNWWKHINEVEYSTAYIYCFDKNSIDNSVSLYIKSGKIVDCSLEINGRFITWDKQYVLNYLNENQHRVFSIYKDVNICFKHDIDEKYVSSHIYSFDGINIYSIDGCNKEAPYRYD